MKIKLTNGDTLNVTKKEREEVMQCKMFTYVKNGVTRTAFTKHIVATKGVKNGRLIFEN